MLSNEPYRFTPSTSPDQPADWESNHWILSLIPRIVVLVACCWITYFAGQSIAGWIAGTGRATLLPTPTPGTHMMPLTAAGLLLCAGALWLLRDERLAHGPRRWIASAMAGLLTLLGSVLLWEYIWVLGVGTDLVLFPRTVGEFVKQLPGRASVASSFALLSLGLSLICLDARSKHLRRAAEVLALTVGGLMLMRLIGHIYGERGIYAPGWKIFGSPVLGPTAATTASCFLALALGILFSRPQRGLVGLFLSPGLAGTMARWLLPLSLLAPIFFGDLGLIASRAEVLGIEYPLSVIVGTMILLLVAVTSLNARTIRRVDQQRSRAISVLAEKERLLRAVFDNAGAGLALIDEQGRPVFTNKTLRKMLGHSPEEIAEIPFDRWSHPDDRAKDEQLFRELISGALDSYRVEKRYARKNGQYFWGQLNTSVSRDPHNHAEFLVAMLEDISERKEADDTLTRFKAVLDATPDFVGMADAQSRAIYVNRAGREMTGIGDDLSGLFIPDFHPQQVADRVLNEAMPAAATDGVWSGETELLGSGGEHIPVSQVLLAHRPPDGDVAYYSTIMRDITEHKHYEDAAEYLVAASRAFAGSLEMDAVLRSIAELTVPARADYCAVDIIGPDGTIEKAAVAHAKPGRSDVSTKLRTHSVGKEPAPVMKEVMERGDAILIREVTDEWLTKLTDGRRHQELLGATRPQSAMLIPLQGRERVIGIICLSVTRPGRHFGTYEFTLAKGVAARAALALDNARLFQQSREATRLRDEVLRVVAHDLRNPLNTISLSSDLLHDRLPKTERGDWGHALDIITRSVQYAERLIQDLLDVARMEVGKFPLETHDTDPHGLVREAVELQKPAASQRGIQLRPVTKDQLPPVPADRHRLLQVLANLIGNAIKFSPEGSTVLILTVKQKEALRFSVQDQGPGISSHDLPHLFDPFWQARKGAGGSGLGLAICKGIVKAHGGQIWVESEPGAGSTFHFTLPLSSNSQQSDHSLAAD